MPTLDVSDAFDASFMDTCTVIRRAQTISNKGRVILKETPQTVAVVVIAASPDDVQRLPEAEHMNKSIRVTSKNFRLQGPAVDEIGNVTLPDQILWHGSIYTIMTVDDYSNYGVGFTSCVATSTTQPDPPVMPAPVGSA